MDRATPARRKGCVCSCAMDRVDPPPPPPREGPSLVERLRASPVTVALFAINTVVFLLAESKGSTTDTATLIRFGAVEPLHVWSGEYWRLASYMFLHIGWIHFLWNTAMGVSMCMLLERALGRWRFFVLYLASGIAGGAATTLVMAPVVSAGASGALFGILGATLALRRRQLPSWPAMLRDPPSRNTFIMTAIWIAIGSRASFNNQAHLGGMIAGALMAWIFTAPSRVARVWGWAAFAAAFGALLVFATKPWMLGHTTPEPPAPFAEYDEDNPLFKRCEAGDKVACNTLMLREPEPPVDLLKLACETGDHDACGAQGWAVANGKGTPKDPDRGTKLMADACDHGSAWSCRLAKGAPLDEK